MSTKIVVLKQFKPKRKKCISLNDFLERAQKLKKEVEEKTDCLLIVTPDDLEKMFEVRLNDFLIENRFLNTSYFMCSLFVASLLKETGFSVPESWYAMDYILKEDETGDPLLLLDGANNCFLLSTLFVDRCNRRGMKREDYLHMGATMYKRFYDKTGREVAYFMSNSFEVMSSATSSCIKDMKLE